ncbi:hypothetical protein ERD78_08710 [Allopusillimonas soli]|uniref:Uncharacterized protein n=1 Tax=Allopusillimonas soli TaxID=659016 RepID=A0A853FDN2_9BURK|nr:hypothetical protein [Allopusillimonas soli]NYT36950.1 hypothetical protein [Allopusillimonas soli]TEA75401.1 hypothetical protein ERD78_08710 [Allopusillimonas soli]
MAKDIYSLLSDELNNKTSADIPIKKLQEFAGDDWLLVVTEQAQRLNAIAEPSPGDKRLARIRRSKQPK